MRNFVPEFENYQEMKKILTLLLAALGLNTACSQNFENMEVKEFAELIADSNVVILDVRKADEFAEGHVKGAILIDQFQSDFVEQAQAKLPKDKTIAVYCRSGRRSANAAGKLADVGYKCVNLKGGILAWKEANMPVIKEEQTMAYMNKYQSDDYPLLTTDHLLISKSFVARQQIDDAAIGEAVLQDVVLHNLVVAVSIYTDVPIM